MPADDGTLVTAEFGVNELSQKISHKDFAGTTRLYSTDAAGNLQYSIDPYNWTRNIRDYINASLQRVYSNGWQDKQFFDNFDNVAIKTDLGGATITLTRDKKQQVIRRKITGGQRTGMYVLDTQYQPVLVQMQDGTYMTVNTDTYMPRLTGTPDQDLEYTFKNGFLVQLRDHANQRDTLFAYDTEGSIVTVTYQKLDGTLIRQFNSTFDALRRIVVSSDATLNVHSGYDLDGNLRYLQTIFHDPATNEPKTDDYWNFFDAAARVTKERANKDGSAKAGTLAMTHVKGRRVQQSQWLVNNPNPLVTDMKYTAAGRLSTTNSSDGSNSTRQYNNNGTETSYLDPHTLRQSGLDAIDRVKTQHVVVTGGSTSDITNDYQNAPLPSGQPVTQNVTYSDVDHKADGMLVGAAITDKSTFNVALFESPALSGIYTSRSAYRDSSGLTSLLYDANRSQNAIKNQNMTEDSSNDPSKNFIAIIESMSNGMAICKYTLPLSIDGQMALSVRRENFYYLQGQVFV